MPDSTPINPYASPQTETQPPPPLASRGQALASVRWALVILAAGVAVNIWASFYWSAPPAHLSYDPRPLFATTNAIFFAFVFVVLWLVALRLIELPARWLHALFGGQVSHDAWMTALHHALWPMVPAALTGAMLWVAWLCLIHFAGHPGGFTLDVVFQIAGHLLGAWVYGNVLWQWYLLRREHNAITASS